jgi:threonyl-tRNA synthetase
MENHDLEINSDSPLYRTRHSLAHIMAQAIQDYRPGTKLGFGPAIEEGFYYDFLLSEPISDTDFKEIEKRMKKIIGQNQKFEVEHLNFDDAMKRLDDMGEPYKKEYAKELFEKKSLKTLTFYKNGKFVDMCEGPHVGSTKEINADCFKLRRTSAAYWRGDSKNQSLTRIYAWCFESKEKLDAYIKAFEEALARDHKKLGKELELFFIDEEIGKGLPLWQPNGTILRDEIEKLMRELEFTDHYQRVSTPVLAKASLYYKTGHLPYYKDGMFPFMEMKEHKEGPDGEKVEVTESYVLRPMNCPHHHKIFGSRLRSYRELPVRFAEYGNVHRYEDSGAVSGLLRVRGMCMNDAHIYCTEDQIKDEFLKVMRMHETLYNLLGLKNYYMRLSTWDPEDPKGKDKYVDNPAAWEFSQNKVREAMVESGLPFIEKKGEAAFYGPKIDFQFKTVTGREETASTNQLDFAVPGRLGLTYVGADNVDHTPYCIHRAPAGTHERFTAFLIEHFGGAFPTWLAPTQVKVITVSEKFNDYGQKIVDLLRSQFVRIELDNSEESFNKKIRLNTMRKIPNILIIGENEVTSNSVTLRRYGHQQQEVMELSKFAQWVMDKIKTRALN